jgi:hypothetical protein
MISTPTNLDYLIDFVRVQVGDLTPPYRYTDDMLRTTLVAAVQDLQRWWNNRYMLDSSYNVYRNPNMEFLVPEPPIIQDADIKPIKLMASIIIKSGTLENMSYSFGSWRDAEVSYSNIEGGRQKDTSLQRDWDELYAIMLPPTKRLAGAIKGSLPGYLRNSWERDTEF